MNKHRYIVLESVDGIPYTIDLGRDVQVVELANGNYHLTFSFMWSTLTVEFNIFSKQRFDQLKRFYEAVVK